MDTAPHPFTVLLGILNGHRVTAVAVTYILAVSWEEAWQRVKPLAGSRRTQILAVIPGHVQVHRHGPVGVIPSDDVPLEWKSYLDLEPGDERRN